jgi:hypothetical protein
MAPAPALQLPFPQQAFTAGAEIVEWWFLSSSSIQALCHNSAGVHGIIHRFGLPLN